jgi:hemerythrin-like domain-containing protein
MKLIPQLKREHIDIMRSFDLIRENISTGKPGDEDLVNQLRELKDVLVSHLDLEDKMLYPVLSGSDSPEAKELGEKFSSEMLGISKSALDFFKEYMYETITDLLRSSNFRAELDIIIKAVTKRVEAEEDILYPAYEKYCDDSVGDEE